MQKKHQKITVLVMVIIISISLIGSSFVAIFQPGEEQSAQGQNKAVFEKEYKNRQETVGLLDKKLAENPNDSQVQLALADAYYDKARVSGQIDQQEYEEDLQKAIDLYQAYLTKNEDNAVLFKLGFTAFLRGNNELAESTYQKLLVQNPQNIDALYGYGMLLFYNMKDYQQAEEKWQQALSYTTDEQMKKKLEEMISLVKVINSNPAEKKEN